MNEAIVIEGKEDIEKFRLTIIESGLRLEALTGLKHSRNGPRLAAQLTLRAAGQTPKRTSKALYEQFKAYRATLTA